MLISFNMNLIQKLIKQGYLRNEKVIEAFLKVKRVDFLLSEDRVRENLNEPLSIGFGQTISQPLTVALMLEFLEPESGQVILDVGSGSGWTTALLAEIVGDKGKVYGLEIIKELADFSVKNINKYGYIEKGIAEINNSDGYEGLSDKAPFDRILVSAAATNVPEKLLGQLKTGGRLVIPIGEEGNIQNLAVINKKEDGYEQKIYPGFIFVPLVKKSLT